VARRAGLNVHRDRLRAGAHFELHAVVLAQQAKLLEVVVAVQVGPRERGFEATGPGDEAVRQTHVLEHVLQHRGFGVDAYKGVTSTDVPRQGFTRHKAMHGIAKVVDLLRVNGAHLRQRTLRFNVA
jgi:hypothetical protein